MGLEVATFISGLVATNPVGATDPKSQGDDHIRLIKATLLATFPAITGAITATHTELNQLHGGVISSIGNGAAATPSYSFANDPDVGMYRVGADTLGFATAGNLRLSIVAGGITAVPPLYGPDGSAGTPTWSFTNDPDTGVFREAADRVAFAAGGTRMLRVASDLKTVTAYGGSSSADNAFVVNNFAANATFFAIRGDGQAEHSAGTAANPGISFLTEPDCGLYLDSANSVTMSTGGSSHVTFRDNGGGALFIDINKGPLRNNDGAVGTPPYTFFNDPDTGLYRIAGNQIGVAVGGVNALDISGSRIALNVHTEAGDGSQAAPAYSFANDPDTGIYRSNTNTLAFTAGNNTVASAIVFGSGVAAFGVSVLALVDGITAPATTGGNALIYVDSADGDLKIKFSDGTVKTIVVDT